MQELSQALQDIQQIYQKVVGRPAPEIGPDAYVAFPPGVDPVTHAIHEVDQLKKFSQGLESVRRPVAWVPPADSFVTPEAFVVRLEVPGVSRDSLEVFVSGGECIVRGDRPAPERGVTEMRPVAIERPWGPFERRFALPAGVRSDAVKAKYTEGMLEVRVEVEAETARRETKVEVA